MASTETHATIDAVYRIEAARLIAGLARMTGDIGRAEDLAQDALVAALEQWSRDGVPANPGAWLMTVAKRRAVDQARRDIRFEQKREALAREQAAFAPFAPPADASLADTAGLDDDILRLIFTACHPVLSREARVALTLRVVGGLTVPEIARAFLVPEPTIAQRIVRAKRTLAKAGVPFEVPGGPELQLRLASVLEVIYLIFNEGYSATSGGDWMRPELCQDALRLGRILAGLLPGEAEVHGLLALMEIQASRTRARTGRDGEPILLLEQDRSRWDQLLIRRGLAALARAERLAPQREPYTLQAAIAACHARAIEASDTDWARIAALYGELAALTASPVVELNRAVAVSMADGPGAALPIVDGLVQQAALHRYHLLWGVRGDLLFKLERFAEARVDFERAAALTGNDRERSLLERRAAACSQSV